MAEAVTIDELKEMVGQETGVSDWFEIDQERINQFADVTLDHQFIHVDTEKAKMTPFGTTIAHGFLTLSMLPYLGESGAVPVKGTAMGVNYGTDKVRFLSPVKVNSKIRSRSTLKSVEEKGPGRYLITNTITVEIDGEDKPALIADWLSMIFIQ